MTRSRHTRALTDLWITTTLGAYFFFIVQNLAYDIPLLPQLGYSTVVEMLMRYGYLLWFVSYFFVSNHRNNNAGEIKARDFVFDVVQCVVAFSAAYYMGFLTRTDAHHTKSIVEAVVAANAAVVIICLGSLIGFRKTSSDELNSLRACGALFATVSGVFAVATGLENSLDLTFAMIWMSFVWSVLVVHWQDSVGDAGSELRPGGGA